MKPLLIAGFHRSGTSAVARVLHSAGLFLGDDLLGAEPSNPHGHFEDNEVISIHNDILEMNGLDWKVDAPLDPYVGKAQWQAIDAFVRQRRSGQQPWGFKDPRLCLLLPLWLHVIPDANVLVVFRRPGETIRSLHMRHSRQHVLFGGREQPHVEFWTRQDLGVRLWLNYHRTLLSSLPDDDRVHYVNFGDRVAVGEVASDIRERFGVELGEPDVSVVDGQLGNTNIDPIRVEDHGLVTEVSDLWQTLLRRCEQSQAKLRPAKMP